MKKITCRDGEEVFVDDDVYEEVSNFNWYIDRGSPASYMYVDNEYKRMYLKKFVLMDEFDNIEQLMKTKVYNKDGNKFNCTRDNLHFVRKSTDYNDMGNYVIIYTNNNDEILIDKDDWETLKPLSIYLANGTPIVTKHNGKRNVRLAKIILKMEDKGTVNIYSKNGNKCDLRKSNLSLTNKNIIEKDNTVEVLFNNDEKCILDKEFLYLIEENNVVLNKNGYVYIDIGKKRVPIHRVIMGAKDGEYVDHINWNTLDNRKENLRIVTNSQNMLNRKDAQKNNSSGYRGVHKSGISGKWVARVTVEGRDIRLGLYDNPKEAHKAISNYRRKNVPHSEMDRRNI